MPLNMNTIGTGTGICTAKKSGIPHVSLSYRLQQISSLYTESHTWSVGSGKSNCVYVLYSAVNNSNYSAYDVTVQKGTLRGAEIIFTSIKFIITRPPDMNSSFYVSIGASYGSGGTVIPSQNDPNILYFLFGDSNNVYKQYIYKCVISTQTSTLIASSIYSSSYFPGYGVGLMRMNVYDNYAVSIGSPSGNPVYINGYTYDLNTGAQKYINKKLNDIPTGGDYSSHPIYGTPYYLIQNGYTFGRFWIYNVSNDSVMELNSPYKAPGRFGAYYSHTAFIPKSESTVYGDNTYNRQAYSREIKKDVYIVGQNGFMIYVDMSKKYAEVLSAKPEHVSTIMINEDGECYSEGILDYIVDSGSVSSSYRMYMAGIGSNYPFIIYDIGRNDIKYGIYQMQIDATI